VYTHHVRKVTAYLAEHPCLELLYGARYQQWPAGHQHSEGDSHRAV
jgi:hypothetical protein